MLEKQEVREFFNWLDTASEKEKWERHLYYCDMLSEVEEIGGDIRYLISHIEDELLADLQAGKMSMDRKLIDAKGLKDRFVIQENIDNTRRYIATLEKKLYIK